MANDNQRVHQQSDCEWYMDANTDCTIWETTCGNAFVFEDGGPIENKMKFCCYCGKSLRETRAETDDDEE